MHQKQIANNHIKTTKYRKCPCNKWERRSCASQWWSLFLVGAWLPSFVKSWSITFSCTKTAIQIYVGVLYLRQFSGKATHLSMISYLKRQNEKQELKFVVAFIIPSWQPKRLHTSFNVHFWVSTAFSVSKIQRRWSVTSSGWEHTIQKKGTKLPCMLLFCSGAVAECSRTIL